MRAMSKVGTATAGGAGDGVAGAAGGGAAAGAGALDVVDGVDCGTAAVGLVALSRTACSLIRTCHATPRPAAITIAPANHEPDNSA